MRLLIWVASLFGLKRLLLDPERSRMAKTAITVLVAVAAFVLLSAFFGLFGRLWAQSRGLALAYASLVTLVIAFAAWRLSAPAASKPSRRNPYAQRRHAERAAAGIAARMQQNSADDRGLVLIGLPGVGRHALCAALQARTGATDILIADDLSADVAGNAIVARRCPRAAAAILVVTQDLFSYQMPVIEELAARDEMSLVIFLNKCDLLDREARTRILDAIAEKCGDWPVVVRSGAAAPRPREVVEIDAHGRETARRQDAPPDLGQLLDILGIGDKLGA